jgi:hypothetical protein
MNDQPSKTAMPRSEAATANIIMWVDGVIFPLGGITLLKEPTHLDQEVATW